MMKLPRKEERREEITAEVEKLYPKSPRETNIQ